MKPKVIITKKIPYQVEMFIKEHCQYEMWQDTGEMPDKLLLNKVSDADGLMGPHIRVTEELLDKAPKLKIISNIAVGYDNFDIELMKKRKIMGTHTPEVLDESVADLAFGLILSTARKIGYLDAYTKKGNWDMLDKPEFLGQDVYNKTLGIIGLGRIGSKVAKRAALGFDMQVLYYNRSRKKDVEENLGIKYASMEELLKESDYVLLMLPLTKETEKMFGEKEFALMKDTGFFINVSRGKIVDEKALINALKTKAIAGAGLDVYEDEPIQKDNPLLKMSNVVTLPHIGSATEKTRFDMAMKAAENLVAAVKGKRPENLVPELRAQF
ncbi:MAG: D-glycerate dehydrogenase [Thermotaleaceae bacterium]